MGEKTNDILFGRSVFGGFDRKNVMAYIDDLHRQMHEQLQTQQQLSEARIAQLTQALSDADAQCAALREEAALLRAQTEELQAENARLRIRDRSPASIDDVDAMVHRNLD